MNNSKITFLGPVGATFSHDAYNILAEIYGAPAVATINTVPAHSNGEILKLVREHGGYGAIAMETLAEGRVAEPLESFIDLLMSYGKNTDCLFRIVGAIRLRLHFCLMVRPGLLKSVVTRVIAHPKALGACKGKVAGLGLSTLDAVSNGEAARLVAESDGDDYATSAALGPRSAALKYGLEILDDAFEDTLAITTFFLIASRAHRVTVGEENRILIVFKTPHEPGALVKSLQPFADQGLNLIQIHSVHVGNSTYNFAIELDVKKDQVKALEGAMEVFGAYVGTYLSFGPFEVLTR